MSREGKSLVAYLPHQPPAGKLQYKVVLNYNGAKIALNKDSPVIIRFKGSVPIIVLLPHIIFMFFAMFLSNRAGLEAIRPASHLRNYVFWTTVFLFLGGMMLGPVVQKYAFGDFWTGFPFGHDLTDNKTLIGMIGWIAAFINVYKKKTSARWWTLGAAVLLLVIYLVPHSLMGSELDYTKTN